MGKPRFRHELKYQIPLSQAEEFFNDVMPYCEYDPHAGDLKVYEIASTYYDTRNLIFYADREESVGHRRKVRLRTYNEGGKATAMFLEIKEKHNQFVSKKRLYLKDRSVLENGIPHVRLPLHYIVDHLEDGAEAREFAYLSKRLDLVPVVIIRYMRKAVIPTFDHDMRITLDTRITAGGDYLHLYDADKEKLLLRPDEGVLEVKSNQGIPLWLHGILQRHQLVQTRYSKYCLGVDAVFGPQKPWIAMMAEHERLEEETPLLEIPQVEQTPFKKAV